MHYALTITTEAAEEPVSIADAKVHLRVPADIVDDDAYIGALITAARDHIEKITGRAIASQTYRLDLDYWPGREIKLPRAPVTAVSSVKYYDADSTLQTFAASNYTSDLASDPARIWLDDGASWPSAEDRPGAIQITFVAGSASIPARLRVALLLLVGTWFDHRASIADSASMVIPDTLGRLLGTEKVFGV